MDLDSAIQHCEEVADTPCFTDEEAKCYSEHRQLAEWLRELKAYRNKSEISTGCGDAVSRQAVFEQIAEWIISGEYGFTNATDYLSKKIKALPSVTPQQRTGRWIKQNYGWNWQCSECGFVTPPSAKEIFTFCPKCGCKMEVEG